MGAPSMRAWLAAALLGAGGSSTPSAAGAREFPSAPAILAPDRDVLTHEALARQLDATAHALAEAGFGVGSRVALALPDGPEYAVALLAVSGCATCAPVSPDLDEAALTRLFASIRIDALIAPDAVDSAATRAARAAGMVILGLRFSAIDPPGT